MPSPRPLPPVARACLAILGLLALACVVGPWLLRIDPHRPDWDFLSAAPSFASGHLFGTDAIGRDVLARTLAGGRLSLGIGLLASVIALVIGLAYGAVAGLAGGAWERAMLRLLDVLSALPFLLLVILLLALFGRARSRRQHRPAVALAPAAQPAAAGAGLPRLDPAAGHPGGKLPRLPGPVGGRAFGQLGQPVVRRQPGTGRRALDPAVSRRLPGGDAGQLPAAGRPPGDELLRTEGLTLHYPHSTQAAVDSADLQLRAGECLALLGESGSGKSSLGRALLFITHDLAAARALADRIAVMAAGRIVEQGPAAALLGGARTPLARHLLGLSGAADAVAIT